MVIRFILEACRIIGVLGIVSCIIVFISYSFVWNLNTIAVSLAIFFLPIFIAFFIIGYISEIIGTIKRILA